VRLHISGPADDDALTHEGTAHVYLLSRLRLLQKPLGVVFDQFSQTYRAAEEAQRGVVEAVAAVAAGKGTPEDAAAKLASDDGRLGDARRDAGVRGAVAA
jgi:hypothetical protein